MTLNKRCAIAALLLAAASVASAEPVEYTGTAVLSGQLGHVAFKYAPVTITMFSDTRFAVPFIFSNGTLVKGQGCTAPPHAAGLIACGYINDVGTTIVTVKVGEETHTATFTPDAQLFVSFDVQNGGIGFGRYYQSGLVPPYPLSFKAGNILAVSDLMYNQTTGYSQGIIDSVSNLAQATRLSGDAIACDNPFGKGCTDPMANPGALVLPTDHGSFYLTNPYVDKTPKMVNAGIFTVRVGRHHDRDHDRDRD